MEHALYTAAASTMLIDIQVHAMPERGVAILTSCMATRQAIIQNSLANANSMSSLAMRNCVVACLSAKRRSHVANVSSAAVKAFAAGTAAAAAAAAPQKGCSCRTDNSSGVGPMVLSLASPPLPEKRFLMLAAPSHLIKRHCPQHKLLR
eukprot:CAMPEP_0172718074 /NCGR_PEP_ID=MMETSP1074-20121228/73297_1 /TAXON_ID=2916 /ORGANISM="Ceratium fusus, Strain PA161109" /LENGTH=148 /DNA_ID=CAMNT_0013543157 /DNA_START=711 /DNA_END=1157 /DNA_ORIENTATION=-